MRRIGAAVVVAALGAVTCSTPPAAAFGLSLGPLHLGLPLPGPVHGFRHRRHLPPPSIVHSAKGLHDEANFDHVKPQPDERQPGAARESLGPKSPLLTPVLASPAILDAIVWPSSPPSWPFGYDAILQTAFAKARPGQDVRPCQQTDRGAALLERIKNEVKPNAAQRQQLRRFGGAVAMASAALAKSCPASVAQDPVARLDLMEWQVERLARALDMVRQPLQGFLQSLNGKQRARLESAPSANHSDRSANVAATCAASPTDSERSIEQISAAVDPTDAQHEAMTNLKDAFSRTASELDAFCPSALPANPVSRLEAIEARLDATWRATVSIQVALANFEKSLSPDQRSRFGASDLTATR